ncbi:MAG: D-alanine--D-alanine ligase [Candidatus Omnitrophota bacterium]
MSVDGKRIGVLMGGCSSEREISLVSGRAVSQALRSAGKTVVPLELLCETEEEILRLVREHMVDIVFVAMHGGFGEDGRLQRILEKACIPFTGPQSEPSRLAMDKIASRWMFRQAGLHIPKARVVRGRLYFWSILGLRYPLVVKPSNQGSSIGISFVDSSAGLKKAVETALRFSPSVLVEEYIKGREITVSVLDGKALPVVEIVPKKQFFDYQAKYEQGFTEYVVPARLDEAVLKQAQQDAVTAYWTLGCRHLSRADMIISNDNVPILLEVNTIPGFTERSLFPKAAQAAGISFDRLCLKLVELANGQK